MREWSNRQSTSLSTSLLVCRSSSSCFWGILRFSIRIGRWATNTTLCIEGTRRIFEDCLPIAIYTGHSFLLQAKFERCVPSDMKIKRTRLSLTLRIDSTSISTSSPPDVSPYLCLPPPVRSMHFSIEAFWWRISVKATLRGIKTMLGVGWLPHQASYSFDDVSTSVFDRVLAIVMPSHILERVQFPLPESLIIWHASHELLDAIPVLKLGKHRVVFASFSTLSLYVFMLFFLIAQWVYLYSSRVANGY